MGRCIRIERVENGYTVCATDPKIAENNKKPNTPWRDAEREYVFKTIGEAVTFISKIADKAMPLDPAPPDSFASAFDAAVASDDKDGDK